MQPVLTGLTCLLLVATGSRGTPTAPRPTSAPPPQDCLISGLTPDNRANPAPTIANTGTTTGTNGAGCDGCKVTWHVTITWNHTGTGSWIVNGIRFDDDHVAPGEVQSVDSTVAIDMGCDTTQTISATNNQGGQSSITVRCNQCQ